MPQEVHLKKCIHPLPLSFGASWLIFTLFLQFCLSFGLFFTYLSYVSWFYWRSCLHLCFFIYYCFYYYCFYCFNLLLLLFIIAKRGRDILTLLCRQDQSYLKCIFLLVLCIFMLSKYLNGIKFHNYKMWNVFALT